MPKGKHDVDEDAVHEDTSAFAVGADNGAVHINLESAHESLESGDV